MKTMSARLVALPMALLLSAALIAGCSSEPQEQYNDATQALKQARQKQQEALKNYKQKQDKLEKLHDKLEAAREKVQQATRKVDKVVNDEVLFRTLQRKLLSSEKFEDSAISVGVRNRVVTLNGNVPDEEAHKRALKIARSQWGVKRVVDSLQTRETKKAPSGGGQG